MRYFLLGIFLLTTMLSAEEVFRTREQITSNVRIGFRYAEANHGANPDAAQPKPGIIYGPGPLLNSGTHEWLNAGADYSTLKALGNDLIQIEYRMKRAEGNSFYTTVTYERKTYKNYPQQGHVFFGEVSETIYWVVLHVTIKNG